MYADALPPEDRITFTHALKSEGLDREIALIRLFIAKNIQHPEEIPTWIDLLVSAVKAQHRISKQSEDDLYANLLAVIKGLGEQLLPEGA